MRSPGETWYQGTADAIYQNINLVEQSDPHVVAIFGGDHIYRMNITSMIEYHVQKERRGHRGGHPRGRAAGRRVRRDRGRRRRPHPRLPREEPRRSHHARRCRARLRLHGQLHLLHAHPAAPAARRCRRAEQQSRFRPRHPAQAGRQRRDLRLRFPDQPHSRRSRPTPFPTGATSAPSTPITKPTWTCAPSAPRSISTTANGRCAPPAIPTRPPSSPSTKRTAAAQAIDSIVSGGCILSGGMVRNSVLGRGVRVHSGALVDDCVILDNCDIGRRAKVRRAILDKNVRVPEDASIGYDLDADRQRFPRHRKRHRGGGRQPLASGRDHPSGLMVGRGVLALFAGPAPTSFVGPSAFLESSSPNGTTDPRLDLPIRLLRHLLPADLRHRRPARAG